MKTDKDHKFLIASIAALILTGSSIGLMAMGVFEPGLLNTYFVAGLLLYVPSFFALKYANRAGNELDKALDAKMDALKAQLTELIHPQPLDEFLEQYPDVKAMFDKYESIK